MNINEYLKSLNQKSNEIFDLTVSNSNNLGEIHHVSAFIYEFSECLFDENEKEILTTVSAQFETSLLNLTMGMYRQAFSSMRLAFEMGLGAVYFSINKLEHNEWINGKNDIKWSKLIDVDNGILSKRFSEAFFEELSPNIIEYNGKAKNIYREMSEFVHGNNETWKKSGLELEYNEDLKNRYFDNFKEITHILLFVLCCRYLKSIKNNDLDSISIFILEEMNDIEEIRKYLSLKNGE